MNSHRWVKPILTRERNDWTVSDSVRYFYILSIDAAGFTFSLVVNNAIAQAELRSERNQCAQVDKSDTQRRLTSQKDYRDLLER